MVDQRAPEGSAALTKGFIRELEGLRAIAITAVMVHRFWPREGPLAGWGKVTDLGWMGVDLFFVISGFLIAGILFDTRGEAGYFKNFYARRALRIFPLYYLFIGAILVVFPLLQGGPYFETEFVQSAGSPLYYLFYLGNVPEMIGHEPPFFLAPVWSLAIEEQFYLVFPLLVVLLSRRNIVRVLVVAVLFAPVFRAVMYLLYPAHERIQYLATPSRFDEIALGCLLAAGLRWLPFRLERRHANLALGGAASVFLVALATSGLDRTGVFGRIGGYSIVAFTCAAVVLWAVAHRDQPVTRLLRLGPVMYVGKLCYGLYLLHRPASYLVDEALTRWPVAATTSAASVLIKLMVALGLAMLSWYLFERPLLALKRHFASASAPAGTDAPVAAPLAAPAGPAVLADR